MKTKDHTIKFILDNIKMSEKRVQRVITDVIKYFDDYYYAENPVIELLTGAPFKETSAFNVGVLAANAKDIMGHGDVDINSIQITGINNISKYLYISWRRTNDNFVYDDKISFDTYESYEKEYMRHLNDDAADAATK